MSIRECIDRQRVMGFQAVVLGIALFGSWSSVEGQWSNRYPKVDGFRHHVYLEGYELPILTAGAVDPASSPDGRRLAFASHGWLWILELDSQVVTQLTHSPAIDSRPQWSRDGRYLAFVRDTGEDTHIVILHLQDRSERTIDSPAIDLDPAFSPDGRSIYYSSGQAGGLDIWKYSTATGQSERITGMTGVERNPVLLADGNTLVYFHGPSSSSRSIRVRSFLDGSDRAIQSTSIAGQLSIGAHPSQRSIAFSWPETDSWRILATDIDEPIPVRELARGSGLPQTPEWSGDGNEVYFSEPDEHQQFYLYQVPGAGGKSTRVEIKEWKSAVEWTNLRVRTQLEGGQATAPARLSVTTVSGHPIPSTGGPTYFDSQNGVHYFYSSGEIEILVPVGDIQVTAVQGLLTPPQTVRITASAGETRSADITLEPVWEPAGAGWAATDHHFHLNYDGPYRMTADDIEPLMLGEAIDVATPLTANLHNRLQDQAFEGFVGSPQGRILRFGQEVRPHFHGHTGLVGPRKFFAPWFWGAGYPTYGETDLVNGSVHEFVRQQGGIATYMHPVGNTDNPFSEDGLARIPLEVVSDVVLGDLPGLEIVCAWSDELATAQLWYRFLSIGQPVLGMAGTDMFVDFHRTPALGAARMFVDMGGRELTWEGYLERLRGGHSMVTSGPVLLLDVDGSKPGDTVSGGAVKTWKLTLHSAISVDRVDLLVNGVVAWSSDGLASAGTREFSGQVTVPDGGWLAARAYGGTTSWPVMNSYPFGHTAPVWIESVGSTDPVARETAARDLLRAVAAAEARALQRYGDQPVPNLMSRFAQARLRLQEMLR